MELTPLLLPDAPGSYGRTSRIYRASLHTGTHLDAPEHMVAGGTTAGAIPLERLLGPALILDLRHRLAARSIRAEDLAAAGPEVGRGDRVLLCTGWGSTWQEPEAAQRSPYFTPEACQWCVQQGVALVGIDFMPTRHGEHDFPKRALLAAGIPVLSNLCGLEGVPARRVHLLALPARLLGTEAAPARVLVMVGGSCDAEGPVIALGV